MGCKTLAVVGMLLLAQSGKPLVGQVTTPPDPNEGSLANQELQLADVLALVHSRNPGLNATRAAAAAAATRVAEASTLPDPTFQIGLLNLGLPEFNADMAMSMAPSVQLLQRVPFPGKLSLRGDIAGASSAIAVSDVAEAEWRVRERAADLFYELYAIDRQTSAMRETLTLLEDFQTIAKAMYGSGVGRQADVLRADVEVARMDGEIRKMEAMTKVVAARLNGVLGRPADAAFGSPTLGSLPADVPEQAMLRLWAEEGRPLLDRGRTQVAQAEAREDLAHREIWPDFMLGVTYGQRNRGQGVERMGSLIFGFNLPIHASSRQFALRDEARAARMMFEAQLDAFRSEVDARIGELLAELERAKSLISLYRNEVLPEANATVESALSSYRVGDVDFMTLVDAQMTVNRYQSDLYRLLADYGRSVAGLEAAIGRQLPPSARTLTEDRTEQ